MSAVENPKNPGDQNGEVFVERADLPPGDYFLGALQIFNAAKARYGSGVRIEDSRKGPMLVFFDEAAFDAHQAEEADRLRAELEALYNQPQSSEADK